MNPIKLVFMLLLTITAGYVLGENFMDSLVFGKSYIVILIAIAFVALIWDDIDAVAIAGVLGLYFGFGLCGRILIVDWQTGSLDSPGLVEAIGLCALIALASSAATGLIKEVMLHFFWYDQEERPSY